MTVHPKIGWRVPSDESDRFTSYVRERYGEIEGWRGREIRQAMREWVDSDEFAAVEQEVDRLVRAAGRTPAALSEKKPGSDHPASEETTLVNTRAPRDLQDEFDAAAREQGERPGVHLARALRERRAGGRARRVLDKLDRVSDDAEGLLSEVDPEGDGDMTLRERRTVAICRRLGEQFSKDDLEDAIGAVAGDSQPTLREYRKRVLDRLGYTEHPNKSSLFIPEEQAREYAEEEGIDPDAPAFERKAFADLTDSERVHGLRVELVRRTHRHDGKHALRADTARDEVFDGTPGTRKAKDLMDHAARLGGFETDAKGGTKRLRCDLEAVSDHGVLSDAGLTTEAASGEAGETDTPPEVEADDPDGPDPGVKADAQMDALMSATPVTGGGRSGIG